MAVEVLDYQGFSKLRREDDVDEAMVVHLQNMQNLVTLLAKQQDCTLMAESDAALSDFKKLITLLGGSGHARFRHAPASQLSHIPSQEPHVSHKARSASTLHDAVQTKQVSGFDVQPSSSFSPFNDMDMHDARVHAASPITMDAQKGHVFQPSTSCSRSENEGKGHAHTCGVSVNDTSDALCFPHTDRLNSHTPTLNQLGSPCTEVSKDKNHANLHVSGHARCRDSAANKFCHRDSAVSTLALPQVRNDMPRQTQQPSWRSCTELDQAVLAHKTNSSVLSSLSAEGGAATVSNGKPVISSGRPPLPPKKRKVPEKIEDCTIKCHKSANCHCAKRRMLKTRRVVRVSSMGLNNGDIPADGYSWCIYGEKLSKVSSQPRVYYKCSSVRGCPARKHVERASDDPNMLIVTYGREHLHPRIHKVLMASE